MFPELKEAVSKITNPQKLKWISWSHFEVDEVGGLNQLLEVKSETPGLDFSESYPVPDY